MKRSSTGFQESLSKIPSTAYSVTSGQRQDLNTAPEDNRDAMFQVNHHHHQLSRIAMSARSLMAPIIEVPFNRSLSDFTLIKVIGKGCTGKVFLVKDVQTGHLFALKSIHKRWVMENRQVEHLRAERDILASMIMNHMDDHVQEAQKQQHEILAKQFENTEACIAPPTSAELLPFGLNFIIHLHATFQTSTDLFYLLDYQPGGDLAIMLARQYRLPEHSVCFYTAEIALALHYLHSSIHVVYRDLKPENVLFSQTGHVVLTDFGLSKILRTLSDGSLETTKTFCGTAEYLAAEILAGKPYSFTVDWWSFGVMLYEMLSGTTPFWAEDHAVMYRRILHDTKLALPDSVFSPEAKDLVLRLLKRNPPVRMTFDQLIKHPFYASIDWLKLARQELSAPFIPQLVNPEDVSAFDSCFTKLSPNITPTDVHRSVMNESSQVTKSLITGYRAVSNNLGVPILVQQQQQPGEAGTGGGNFFGGFTFFNPQTFKSDNCVSPPSSAESKQKVGLND